MSAVASPVYVGSTEETLDAVLAPTHDAWVNEARHLLGSASAPGAPDWKRWTTVRWLNDQFLPWFLAEWALLNELRPHLTIREDEMIGAGEEQIAQIRAALDRVARRRGSAAEFTRWHRDFCRRSKCGAPNVSWRRAGSTAGTCRANAPRRLLRGRGGRVGRTAAHAKRAEAVRRALNVEVDYVDQCVAVSLHPGAAGRLAAARSGRSPSRPGWRGPETGVWPWRWCTSPRRSRSISRTLRWWPPERRPWRAPRRPISRASRRGSAETAPRCPPRRSVTGEVGPCLADQARSSVSTWS